MTQYVLIALLSVLIGTAFDTNVSAQDVSLNYFAIKYIKVDPSNESEFLRSQLETWKKIHQKRINEDVLDGWYFFRVVSPAGTNTNYNYITIEEYDSAEKLGDHFEGFGVDYTNILSRDEITLALRTPEISDMTYEEVWRTVDQVFKGDRMYRYQVFNAMRMRPGIAEDEYQRIEREYWIPVHKKRMEMGHMNGWGIYTMIIPGGTEREYHWATVDFYDNFTDYLEPTLRFMSAIYGTKTAEKYLEETESKRDLLKAEIRELVDYVSETFE